jgi:hypothetical protein
MRVANLRTAEGLQAWLDGTADIYLINSELLPNRLPLMFPKRKTFVCPVDTLVIDELSLAKNPQSKRFKALFKHIGAITRLQRLKTGALIGFAAQAGAILGKAPVHMRHTLVAFAHDLGLAFQIADDILDVEGDEAQVGKALRKDDAAGKATFVSLLGLDAARARARDLVTQACDALTRYGEAGETLREAARFVIARRN